MFPSNRLRIVVASKPVGFRKAHDRLAALVENELRKEPFTGTVFEFRAKRADRLKLLYWDRTGLVMAYKRFVMTVRGRIRTPIWQTRSKPSSQATSKARSTIFNRGTTPDRCEQRTAYRIPTVQADHCSGNGSQLDCFPA